MHVASVLLIVHVQLVIVKLAFLAALLFSCLAHVSLRIAVSYQDNLGTCY